jgi:hypothetical protein
VLKRWNGSSLAQIFTLATIALESLKEISLKNEEKGSERALLLLVSVSGRK